MQQLEMTISVDKKTAIVMGATGLIGGKLMEELLLHKAYDKIITLGRTKTAYENDKIEHIPMNFEELIVPDNRIVGHDLFIAFGTTRAVAGSKEKFKEIDYEYPLKVLKSASANGVRQVFLVSSVGASPDAYFHHLKVKGELEEALRRIPFWAIHIFRPSLLLGQRKEKRFREDIAQGMSRGLNFFTRGRVYKYKPIEARDVASAMVKVAQAMNEGIQVYPSEKIHEIAESYK